jgi:uncharacterized membrane protein
MKINLDQQILDTMSKDPGNWKGPFYFNRKDPRLLVPKLYPSLGWTLNFASPYAYTTLILILAIAIGVKLFLSN